MLPFPSHTYDLGIEGVTEIALLSLHRFFETVGAVSHYYNFKAGGREVLDEPKKPKTTEDGPF